MSGNQSSRARQGFREAQVTGNISTAVEIVPGLSGHVIEIYRVRYLTATGSFVLEDDGTAVGEEFPAGSRDTPGLELRTTTVGGGLDVDGADTSGAVVTIEYAYVRPNKRRAAEQYND